MRSKLAHFCLDLQRIDRQLSLWASLETSAIESLEKTEDKNDFSINASANETHMVEKQQREREVSSVLT